MYVYDVKTMTIVRNLPIIFVCEDQGPTRRFPSKRNERIVFEQRFDRIDFRRISNQRAILNDW